MNALNHIAGLTCVFMAICGSAVHAADPQDCLAVYEQDIKSKPTGVYERDGELYVQVLTSMGKRHNPARSKMKSVLTANELLRKWAIDYSSQAKESSPSLPFALQSAVGVLDRANGDWRYYGWSYQARGQEIYGSKDDEYWLCQIVDKDDVIAHIPESFKQSCPPTNLIFRSLSALVPKMAEADRSRLYSDAGAFDLGDCIDNEDGRQEYSEISGAVDEYLKNSAFANEIRSRMNALQMPRVVTSWSEIPGDVETLTNVTIAVTTNLVSECLVKTNVVNRAETLEEQASLGVSEKKLMREEWQTSDYEDIIETRTVTMVETRKTIRRKVVCVTSGMPRFESVFLSGGKSENSVKGRLPSGDMAAKLYFDATATMEARDRTLVNALRENPGDVELWNMLGRCRLKHNDYLGALICFRAAASLDKNNQYMLTNMAEVYDCLGCRHLSSGYAVLGYGLATDAWCKDKCKTLLLK